MSGYQYLNDQVTQESKEYFERKRIKDVMESILVGITYNQPEDPLRFMQDCISKIKEEDLTKKTRGLRWDTFLPPINSTGTPRNIDFITVRKKNQLQAASLPPIPLNIGNSTSVTPSSVGAPAAAPVEASKKPTFAPGAPYSLLPPIASGSNGNMKPRSPRGLAWNNIVFVLGGPGSGKGTQCSRIAKEFNYIHLSSGDLLREEVSAGTDLGREISAMIKEGRLVPTPVTIRLIQAAMERSPESNGFLIDGFPRQLDQAAYFEKNVAECKFVLYFECSEQVLEARLLERGKTSGRADDNLESIKKRFKTFAEASYPVVEAYLRKGKCIKINSERLVDEVYGDARTHFLSHSEASSAPVAPAVVTRGPAWKNIVFVLGGPGSGKGTQCARIAKKYNFNHLSSGDLLRDEVASGSTLGNEINALIKEGRLVPTPITIKLIQTAMEKAVGGNGFLIDGFPRQLDQADYFEKKVAQCRFVLYFECSEVVLEQRLLERGKTSGRADDNLESIKKRFKTFAEASYPVVEAYSGKGKCIKINSERSVDDVFDDVQKVFESTEEVPKLPLKQQSEAWKNIIFVLGGPGSGKGTQCVRIAEHYNLVHLSSGDLLRDEVAAGTTLGKQINDAMKEGKLVPLEVTIRLLQNAMEKKSNMGNGFLLDGFPRQLDQAEYFEKHVAPCKLVLYFECSEEVLEKRLLERGKTSGRSDDNLESIKKRFKTFSENSFPVVQAYLQQGKCVKINSERPVGDVFADTKQALDEKLGTPAIKARGAAWKNIVFVLGGPGCGKGTQCTRIAQEFNYVHLSAGDLLREEVAKGSELGQQLNALMKEGKIVPMETTISLLQAAMEKAPEQDGFLIDGFPRQLDQALYFEEKVAKCKFVLYFKCSQAVMEQRLLERGKTSGRADDNIETIKKRFKTFLDASYPVVERYLKDGKCVEINSEKPVEEVYEEVKSHFKTNQQ